MFEWKKNEGRGESTPSKRETYQEVIDKEWFSEEEKLSVRDGDEKKRRVVKTSKKMCAKRIGYGPVHANG